MGEIEVISTYWRRLSFVIDFCVVCLVHYRLISSNLKKSLQERGTESLTKLSAWSVKITSILFKCRRSIDNSNDFYLFISSWKGSWQQIIQSSKFKTSAKFTNHDQLSRTLVKLFSNPVTEINFTSCATIFNPALSRRCCRHCLYLTWYSVFSERFLSPF